MNVLDTAHSNFGFGAVLAPTPRDTIHRDGTASLYKFRPAQTTAPPIAGRMPLLMVPSMINRWYVLDLRPGASLAQAHAKLALRPGASTGASPKTRTDT